jgi:hypothetical protein
LVTLTPPEEAGIEVEALRQEYLPTCFFSLSNTISYDKFLSLAEFFSASPTLIL